ncbi:hypothetical protein SmJEL517_g00761 [Synchytrium microbalum]|uniref:RNA helicase n=1 Tax=Synchytrium microbalum TaxID=1806994 RepID=A0A507CHC0_9FUNG|nr:uncharacterized protein SmJEL517_g00761 [Synchytrium microbalum]TPX37466.1 hypothetical protein SmJEL517_g00761 [Synchytrium microbalum]
MGKGRKSERGGKPTRGGRGGSKQASQGRPSSPVKKSKKPIKKTLDDDVYNQLAAAGIKVKKSAKLNSQLSNMEKEAARILKLNKRKSKHETPEFLKLSKDMLNKIRYVVGEYHDAAALLASRHVGEGDDTDQEDLKESDDSDSAESEESDDEDTEESASDEEVDSEMAEDEEDDKIIAAYDSFARIDDDDDDDESEAQAPQAHTDNTLAQHPQLEQQPQALIPTENPSFTWLRDIGLPPQICADGVSKHPNNKIDALAFIWRHALKIDAFAKKVPDNDVESMQEDEAMVLDSIYGHRYKRLWSVWEIDTTFKVGVHASKGEMCSFFKAGKCKYGDSCSKLHISNNTGVNTTTIKLEFHIPANYPFESPIIVLRETSARLSIESRLALNIRLQELTNAWIGNAMVFEAVEWLSSAEASQISREPKVVINTLVGYKSVVKTQSVDKGDSKKKLQPAQKDLSAVVQSSSIKSGPVMSNSKSLPTARSLPSTPKPAVSALPTPVIVSKSTPTDESNTLQWLTDIGFPKELCATAIQRKSTGLEALEWLFAYALAIENPLKPTKVIGDDFEQMREDEAMILDSLYEEKFSRDGSVWRITIDWQATEFSVCPDFLTGTCRRGKDCNMAHTSNVSTTLILEFHLPEKYPLETVLVIVREPASVLTTPSRLALNLRMQELAASWTGSLHIHKLVDWISLNEAHRIVNKPPSRYDSVLKYDLLLAHIGADGVPVDVKGKGHVTEVIEDENDDDDYEDIEDEYDEDDDEAYEYEDVLDDGFDDDIFEDDFVIDAKEVQTTKGNKHKKVDKASTKKKSAASAPYDDMPELSTGKKRQSEIGLHDTDDWSLPVLKVKAPVIKASTKPKPSDADINKASAQLLSQQKAMSSNPAYTKMRTQRESLPAFSLQKNIVDTINSNRVVVISGETGCGKTTQVPQFVLDDYIRRNQGGRCKILVTQPRRISAIGVSDRVANERASRLGDMVGYQIRLESRMSAETRILYCTTGILLRRLEGGALNDEDGIDDISHIFVDEVHERSIDSDFLMMVLKDLLEIRKDLKLVLMSATLNAQLFQTYFGESVPLLHIPGRTFPVEVSYLEDALALTNYVPQPNTEFVRKPGGKRAPGPVSAPSQGPYSSKDPKRGAKPEKVITDEQKPDEDLSVEALQKRYPVLNSRSANALLTMNTDTIQYPLVEKLIEWMITQLFGGAAQTQSVPGMSNSGSPRGNSRGGGARGRGARGRGRGGWSQNEVQSAGAQSPQSGSATPAPAGIKPNRGILVFLPGYEEISTLREGLLDNAFVRNATQNGRYVLPVHGSLSSADQARAFERPAENAVKIVIATNVAETSITIDDIVYVIDCGKMKETRFDPSKGMASLEACWVSKANATQRRGRAGRVSTGSCFHLFTSHRFEHQLLAQQDPEIKRTPLEQLCLRIKVLPFLSGKVADILSKIIEPPSVEGVAHAVSTLRVLRALNKDESLTPLGFHLAKLPVDVRIGKLILFGSIFGCLDRVLTIAAALSHQSPFMAPFEKRDIAGERKKGFSLGSSDHLTVLVAYEEWIKARQSGKDKDFLWYNFLSGKTLSMIAGIKRQLLELLSEIGFAPSGLYVRDVERRGGRNSDGVSEALQNTQYVARSDNTSLIKALLISGLYPNVVKIQRPPPTRKPRKGGDKPGKVTLLVRGGDEVHLHPSSVNFQAPLTMPFAVYHEKVKTSKVFIRDATLVSAYALAFFGGRLTAVKHNLNLDDGWIRFLAVKSVSATLQAARTALDELLARKIENPRLEIGGFKLVDVIVDLVTFDGR